ncbi:ATP-binding cassette subfamily C protein [Hoeflea halophila]|uniref:ATP-binding cassette subfamily C protein n=1 Tax=Hoeflea halophila TaxID=714899 RepID=A0A286IAY2_9HYPH|nr:type I secretion system permease/ATPase [Hoeflea halophila]SOE17222.1 ATP-binding cassette subfamily C protein [Hoeflea halophila]
MEKLVRSVTPLSTKAESGRTNSSEIRTDLRICRRGLAVAGLFSLALNLLMLTIPLYMMTVYDRVLTSRSEETLLMLSILAVAALVAIGLLEAVRQLVLTRVAARLQTSLGGPILDASLQTGKDSGSDVQGLRDLDQVRQFVSSPLVSALFDAPVAPIYLALMFLIHPHLGWLSLGAALLIVFVAIVNQRFSRKPLAEATQHSAAALRKAQVQARNAEVVRAMGMFPDCVESWGADAARSLKAAGRASTRNAVLNGLSKFLRLFLQIAILGYGAYLVLADNSLSAGIIFAASIISARALAPLDQAVGGWRSLASAHQAWRRLQQQLRAAPAGPAPMALPAPEARLSVDKLVFLPEAGAVPVLKGLSFSVDPGEVVGIIGPSGAGKSTLARLLVGAIAPSAGVIRLGGDDLQNWSPEALGPHIGYVPQDVELFPASVAQNIARLSGSPDPEKVVAAARMANCHELIQSLPQGYDTVLGLNGYALSGGQRQRIALARAFFGNPRLVVLDEPNATLDSQGEEALIVALRQAQSSGMACVIITQRTSVLPALSKMMLLRDGQIEAFGSKDEVMKSLIRPAGQPEPAGQKANADTLARITARFG